MIESIEIKEDVRIGDIVLEKGDKIQIKESIRPDIVDHYFNGDYQLTLDSLVKFLHEQNLGDTLDKWTSLVKKGYK